MIRSAQNRPFAVTAGLAALATVVAALVVGSAATVRAQGATANQGAAATKSVAALGRLEPAGGIVRLGLPSTPEAISGAVITRLHVERGADVKAGQVLAEADTVRVLKARLAESRADLETARRDAVASVSLAEEACVLAEVAARQSRRQDELLQRRLTSDDVAEQSKGNAEAGAATCKARRAAASVAQSRIASADAAVTRQQAELDRAYVRAPFAGRILDVHAHVGELVGAHGVFELGRVDQMVAIAEVYETDIRHVRVGQKARIKSDALAARPDGHRRPHPAQGAEARRDRHRPRRPQGRAHHRGRDQARRLRAGGLAQPAAGRSRDSALSGMAPAWLSAPLGWKQLRHRPLRLLVAVAGISFAVLLIMMQLGFRSALFESTLRFHERFEYDIALFSPDSVFIVRPAAFSIRRLYQALGADAVEDVSPVYIFPAIWKNPWGTDRRSIQSIGVDPEHGPARHARVLRRARAAAPAGRRAVRRRVASRVRRRPRALRRRRPDHDGGQRPLRSRSWGWSRSARRSASTAR